MPGSGRRSRNGCLRCKARKVKCDEAQPECRRCKTYGFPCPGYKPQTELVFRSMNESVENQVIQTQIQRERPRKIYQHDKSLKIEYLDETPSSSSSSEDGHTAHNQISRPLSRRRGTPLCAPMSTHWINPALNLFFSDYLLEPHEVKAGPGYLENLPNLYSENSAALNHAVSAASLASFSHQARAGELLVAARKLYGRALVLVQKALRDPSQATSDATVAAIYSLGMYETVSGDKPMVHQYGTHADALAMLLPLRGPEQFTSEHCGGVARAAHGMVTFRNLVQRRPPGLESLYWSQSVDETEAWAQPGLAGIRISRLIPVADSILLEEPSPKSGARLLRIIFMGLAEDRRYELWRDTAEYPYLYGLLDRSSLIAQGNPDDIPLPRTIHHYQDLWIGVSWNVYRFARLVLLQTLGQCVSRVREYPDLQSKIPEMEKIGIKISANIEATVDDTCASIPYILGVVDDQGWTRGVYKSALHTKALAKANSMWPLRCLLMVKSLNAEQKTYIFEQLKYMNPKMLGWK